MLKTLASVSSPIDSVDPNKIKNPELQCFSLKYLSEMEAILDKTLNELVGDKANKNLAEEIQDSIMKNKMVFPF